MTALLRLRQQQPNPLLHQTLLGINAFIETRAIPPSLETNIINLASTTGKHVGHVLFSYIRDSVLSGDLQVELAYQRFVEVKVLLDLLSRVFVNDFGALFLHCISAQMSTEEITKAGVEAYMRKRNGEATEDDERVLSTLATVSKHTKLEFTPFPLEIDGEDGPTHDERKLPTLLEWVHEVAQEFTQYGGQDWEEHMQYHLYDTVARTRIEELFSIVVDFPDSKPALLDLKECLDKTGLHNEMIQSYRKAVTKRLLIAGATTTDIITTFISTIKSFSIVDPTGASLKKILPDLMDYLRKREDTVKYVVKMMTEEGGELWEELEEPVSIEDEDEEWEPDVVNTRAYPDIIKIFVDMYRGNKDLFINEYRNELSDRLIKGGYETNAETKIVELLKIRFGDKALQNCEIMLKDISDSKFINQNIHEKISSKEPLDVKIISRNYWPTSAQETADVKEQAKLHPLIQDMQKEFENEYRKLKAPRRLIWQPSLGTIDIIVTLGEQDHPVTTNPVDGSILLYFGESDQWSISSLAEVVNLTPETCLKKCQTWAKNGYLKQLDDELFELQTELTPMNAMMDQDGGSGGESRQQLMRAYDSMVTQMLETMEALELGRIHSMLTMVVMDPMPTYDYDTQELRAYLQELIEEGTLLLDGGLYRLKQ